MAPSIILRGLDHDALVILLLQLSVLLALARVLGELMRRLGQPSVVGELLAGVLLGPTTFGLAFPEIQSALFPMLQSQADLLSVVTWLGALCLLLLTGLETDLALVLKQGRTAVLISLAGMGVSFSTAVALGLFIPEQYLVEPDHRDIFLPFFGAAMSISSVPVIAKVLFDLKLIRRDIGQLTLAAVMTDDTVGWILLSVVAGLVTRGSLDLLSVAVGAGSAIAFVVVSLSLGRRVISGVFTFADRVEAGVGGQLSLLLVLAFGVSALAQSIGIEAILGALVVGILVGQAKRFRAEVSHLLESFTSGFVGPIFFASAGLKVDIVRLLDAELAAIGLAVLVVAVFGKVVGCYLGAWAGGLPFWERLAMGAGMNARGAMQIIVATVGLSIGVLSLEMYSVLVVVALVTSMMAPPMLRFTLARVEIREEEAKRLEREAMAATSFVRSIRRVLVVAQDPEQARIASQLLVHLKNVQAFELTAMYVDADFARASLWRIFTDSRRATQFRETRRAVREAFRTVGGGAIPFRVATGSHAASEVMREAGRGYDLLVMAVAPELRPDGLLFDPVIDHLVREAPCATLVVRGATPERPDGQLRRILVPTTGTEFGRNATEIAAVLAQGAGASMTLIHVFSAVSEGTNDGATDPERSEKIAEDMVEQQLALAKKLGADASSVVEEGASPEATILAASEKGDFDLIMLAASSRGVRQRAYLGRRAEALLRSSKCAVVVVSTLR